MSDTAILRSGASAHRPSVRSAREDATPGVAEERLIVFCSIGAIAIGTIAFAGYILGSPAIASIVPLFNPVAAVSALSFLALAASILLLLDESRTRVAIARALSALVAATAIIEISLPIVTGTGRATAHGGVLLNPYPSTSVLLLLVSVGLFLLPRFPFATHVLSSLALASTSAILFGYILGIESFLDPSRHIAPVRGSVVALFLIASAALLLRPRGWVAIATSRTSTGLMLRVFLPLAVAVPLPVAWLLLSFRTQPWYSREVELTLSTAINGAAFNVLLILSAAALLHGRELRERSLERVLRAISEANQVLIRERNSSTLAESVCRVVVEQGGFRMAWIGRAEYDEQRLVPIATAGHDDGYVAALNIRLDDSPAGSGPSALAVKLGKPQIVDDFASDPRTAPWREAATARGFASSACFPLLTGERSWGALTVYSRFRAAFRSEATTLLEDLAANLSRTIESTAAEEARAVAEEQVRTANAYNRNLLETTLDPLVTISAEGKITDVNAATENATGRRREELIGSDFSDYFTEPGKAREGYRTVLSEGSVRDYPLTLRHQNGTTIDVLYNASVYRDAAGAVQGVFAAARDVTDRKRIEEERHAAALYARSLLEASLDPLVTISPEGRITDVNAATEAVTGCSREALIGRDFSDFFTDPEKARAGYQRVLADGEVRDYALTVRSVSGATIDVLYNATVYRDQQGEIAGVFAAARDVTERKKAEEAQARLAAIVESSSDGIVATTMDGRVIAWNGGAEQLYGYTAAEMVGKPVTIVPPPERTGEIGWMMETIRRGESIRSFETVRMHKDGRRLDVALTVSPVRDAAGHITGAATIIRDITERKKAEEEKRIAAEKLARSAADLARAQEIARLGSWEWNAESDAITWSDGLYRIFGLDPAAGIPGYAAHLPLLYTDESQRRLDALVSRALQNGEPYEVELEVAPAEGRTARWVLGRGEAIRDASGRTIGLRGVALDITERKLAADALSKLVADLENSNRELEQFAYIASHDLQEPLRMVSSFTQLLAQRYGDKLGTDAHDFIGFAVDGANRMQRMINDLLKYSRVGTRGAAFERTDSHAALGAAIANLMVAIDESGALITSEDLPAVLADEAQLTQLFQNLLGNAIKFRRRNDFPRVHISATRDGAMWKFAVADNGIGINPEFQPRLFVIFQRFHHRDAYPGTGIGLAICKRIVERHGGQIWVESDGANGTTFFFTLPAAD